MDVDRAACRAADPEIFFTVEADQIPNTSQRKVTNNQHRRKALRYCAHCPIRDMCRDENLTVPYGIFGGLIPSQRRAIAEPLGIEFEQPDVDEVAIDRRMAGDPVPINRLERLALVRRLTRNGYTSREIAEMAGASGTLIALALAS